MNEAASRPVESFKAFAFKSVNVQFRISKLSCASHCCCNLSAHFCGVPFSQQLSPIPLCRATNPLLSPLCPCTPCPADFASSFTFCSQVSRFVCGLMAHLSHPSRRKNVLSPAHSACACPHPYCQPLLLPPFLQTVVCQGHPSLKKFLDPLVYIQLLYCIFLPNVANLLFYITVLFLSYHKSTDLCRLLWFLFFFLRNKILQISFPFFPDKM